MVHCTATRKVFHREDLHRWFTDRLNDFMRENYLQQVYQSQDQNQMWLIWRADDKELLEMMLKPLSLKTGVAMEIIPLRLKF